MTDLANSFLLVCLGFWGETERNPPTGVFEKLGVYCVAQTQTTSRQPESVVKEAINPGWPPRGRCLTQHQEAVSHGKLLRARELGLKLNL